MMKSVRVHVHVSDYRETVCGAENSWLPVDFDNKETLCDVNNAFEVKESIICCSS